jgi:hypothetical protein
MGRAKGPLVKCDGVWTQAQFNSFIKNNLRSATRKWGPIQKCKKRAHISRGLYQCEGCGQEVTPTNYDETKKARVKNIFVDHIVPIIDPATGFTTWDDCIERMFCDSSNLQLLCKDCHTIKSHEEIEIAKQRRALSKEEVEEITDEE